MRNRLFVPFFFLFFTFLVNAQKENSFGNLTLSDKNFTTYDKDSLANAIVLYEKGEYYFQVIKERIRLVKKYHVKIKILNEKGFDQADISIPYYHSKNSTEIVKDIKAITHNGVLKNHLSKDEIFKNDLGERTSEMRFTFSNIKAGSILEYQYKLISPFFFNLDGWKFQSDIPKLYSEFSAKIPGNFTYNRALIGSLKLSSDEAFVEKECFSIRGYKPADCEVLKYSMKDIPAFKEDEEYMLATSNYISRLDFELSIYHGFDGITDNYTKSWESVDKEFRTDKDFGRQLTKKGFFEKNVPETLLTNGDEITRAKNIYKFVQDHYTWNGKHSTYGKARVKDAFDAKKGNAWEINMSLINLLNSAGIKTNLMLTSTRNNGLPKRGHPVITDFNYVIAKAKVDGKYYLLDATDKFTPFGMLPFKVLNHYGRVMDFENESYWYDIKPAQGNKYQIRASMKFNPAEQKAEGIFDIVTEGYNAITTNKKLDELEEDLYLEQIEKNIEGNLKITDYKKNEAKSDKKVVRERFSFEMDDVLGADMIYLNPFLVRFFNENPFITEDRNYPIDFGYPRTYKYQINIQIPEGYTIHNLPEKIALALDENESATLSFYHRQTLKNIAFLFELSLNQSYFEAQDYKFLQELFKQVTNIQKNSLLVLKKE